MKRRRPLCVPSPALVASIVHHAGVVPTLSLTSEEALADSGVALLVFQAMLHPQDTWVRKIY